MRHALYVDDRSIKSRVFYEKLAPSLWNTFTRELCRAFCFAFIGMIPLFLDGTPFQNIQILSACPEILLYSSADQKLLYFKGFRRDSEPFKRARDGADCRSSANTHAKRNPRNAPTTCTRRNRSSTPQRTAPSQGSAGEPCSEQIKPGIPSRSPHWYSKVALSPVCVRSGAIGATADAHGGLVAR
jgi:hypothetical protein